MKKWLKAIFAPTNETHYESPNGKPSPIYAARGAKTGKAYKVRRKHWEIPIASWGWEAYPVDAEGKEINGPAAKSVYDSTLDRLALSLGYDEPEPVPTTEQHLEKENERLRKLLARAAACWMPYPDCDGKHEGPCLTEAELDEFRK